MDTFVTKAARLNGPRDIELIERELVCGEDDIIVKNHLMGICGSDKNFYRGYLPPKTAEFRQDPKFPFLLGHESGGTVVAVGSRVADYKVGDKVMAFGWNNNFAEYFAAKSFQLQPVPYGLDMDIASLGEPISCAMYSGLNSGVQLGDTVVVMGGGFAGQIIAQCARRKGAYRVIVVDVLEGKLALARRLGADITLNPGQDDVIEAVKDLTNGLGADVVVEAAGTAESFNTASEIIKHNGKFVFYSWVTTPVTLNISRWHDDGLDSSTPASCTTPGSSVMSGARKPCARWPRGSSTSSRSSPTNSSWTTSRPGSTSPTRTMPPSRSYSGRNRAGPPIPPPPEVESRGLAGRPRRPRPWAHAAVQGRPRKKP